MAINRYAHVETLAEYAERFADFFTFRREDGILEMKMHTNGGPVHWSYQFHHALAEVWTAIGHDKENECLIITSTDPYWIAQWDTESFKEVEESGDADQRYNVQIYDTLKVVENFLNDIEIPTIAAVNGRGTHWETAVMSDITLISPDFVLKDNHYAMANGHVPGDGMGMSLQHLLGPKRGNYVMMTGTELLADDLIRLGMANEIVEKPQLLDRAWELARYIMTKNRSCRRLTHKLCVRPWKALVERDFRLHVLAEMYSFNLSASNHDFDAIKWKKTQ